MQHGYFSVHRKILDSPVFTDAGLLKLWIYCLSKATYKERVILVGKQIIHLQPGQFVTGRESLFEDYNKGVKPKQKVSAITLYRWLNTLKNMGNLNIETNSKFSVISIVNWVLYQVSDEQAEQVNEHEVNSKRTASEQQVNTNNKDNKDNKVNKEEKIRVKEFVSLTQKQIDTLTKKYNADGYTQIITILNEYKAKKGKTYDSDYLAITRWVSKRYVEDLQKAAKGGKPIGQSGTSSDQRSAFSEYENVPF